MSHILASVTNVEEALLAVECGVDIIDLKNPAEGALGALPAATIRQIVERVAHRKPVSATIGDLPMLAEQVVTAVSDTAATGVDIVKIGFFGQEGHVACIEALKPLAARGIYLVAVLFADDAPNFGLIQPLAQAGFHGVMLDTAFKNGKRLRHHLDDAALSTFVNSAQEAGLLTGLAGSLALDDLPGLLPLGADYLGFRGALCESANRAAYLERARLEHLLNVLHSCNRIARESVG
jgi:uncharacterized protein (UPF0264 family)